MYELLRFFVKCFLLSVHTPFQVEQLLTNHVLTADPRTLLALSLVAFASAIQVVGYIHKLSFGSFSVLQCSLAPFQIIFAIICVFYDGCPYYGAVVVGSLLLINAVVVIVFCKCRPTRGWLVSSKLVEFKG